VADVVVDQTPKPHGPYDPNDIPEAVRKRAAAVDALYSQSNGSDGSTSQQPSEAPESPPVPPTETPTPPQAPDLAPILPASAEPAPPSPQDDHDDGSDTPANWKRRYARMQGRYESSQKTIGEMQEQLMQMGNELLYTQQRVQSPPRQAPPPAPPPTHYLTEQDVQNYGGELIDVTQRAALQAVAPELQEIRQQNIELQRRLADEARHRMDQQLEMAVPDYREIDRDPRWHRWLLGIDVLSGRVRQQLLNEAKHSALAPRVISFFESFKNEAIATGHREPAPHSPQAAPPREPAINLASLAAPGRARPATGGDASLPPERPTYTRAQIAKLYSDHRRNAYVGREAEWARLEADFFTAQREGRIR
jgi:hypothetical protein